MVFYIRIYGGILDNFSLDRYGPMKTALNELGFVVDFVERQPQKTVIVVSHHGKGDKSPAAEEWGQMDMKLHCR